MVLQIRTATRAVNPAFLQEIKDSNPDLWGTLREVRSFCESPPQAALDRRGLGRFVHLLNELRDLLALQFSLEESYGYLDCQVGVSLEMDDRVRTAIEQHRLIYLTLNDLCDAAEDMQYRGVLMRQARSLFSEVSIFIVFLQSHEQLESDIIELAYFDQRC
jgi:hypothetical protein